MEAHSDTQILTCKSFVILVYRGEILIKPSSEPKRSIVHGGIEVHWRWGKAGLGKTRYVWEKHGLSVYTPTTYKWWEGYDGHKVVLIDEFRGDWCKFGELLKLLDIYPYTVETKGGSRQIQATTFYITSCKPPEEVYNPHAFAREEMVDQLLRRLTTVTNLNEQEDPLKPPAAASSSDP